MIKTIAFAAIAASCALALWLNQTNRVETAVVSAQPVRPVVPAVAAKNRRERMARLVAETAAATADQTAKAVLARKYTPQETAAR